MKSLEQQRLQLIDDYRYISLNYGEFDNVEIYWTMWKHVWSPEMTKESLVKAMREVIEISFRQGVADGGDEMPLPVHVDKRLQQIKRRWLAQR
jgi:hypothetical protein